MLFCDPESPILTPLHSLDSSDIHPVNLGIPAWINTVEADINRHLEAGMSIRDLVYARACAADSLMIALFNYFGLDDTACALFAVGGYGRGELSLHSDLDILLLSPDALDNDAEDKVNQLVAKLWDIGIKPAISVRSVNECLEATKDITVATSLLEARFLAGNTQLDGLPNTPQNLVNEIWSQTKFYDAKMTEAQARYLKHNATEYNLEPDLKNAPGGLRDIHTVGWVTKRYFRISKLYDLVLQDFLTEREFDELMQAESFLWLIRHHLHTLTGRDENKLLFDYQRDLAARMGYEQMEDEHANAAVERFMRDYYRCAMQISTLSEMLTAHYYETLIEARLPDAQRPKTTVLTSHFKQIGDCIAITHHQVFAKHPEAILEMFLLMGQQGIKRIRTRTLRTLKIAARGIDQQYRDNPKHKALFLANLKEQNYLFHRLRLMKRYGVLGNYLPQFASVIGLMQYDLFHRYTVDAHILLLVRMLHRFTDDQYADTFSLVNSIYRRIERKEILTLAAIFHDIAKGRGGDHSELGETDAIEFCLSHGMSQADAELVGWLTRYHLLMSLTAQKQDISDPEVVAKFARTVGNVTHLNHLYVLTVADMNATNPQLWNGWRATLMKQLYTQTRRILRADLDAPTNRQDMIEQTRQQTEHLFQALLDNPTDKLSSYTGISIQTSQKVATHNQPSHIDTQSITPIESADLSHLNIDTVHNLWDELGDDYFLREVPEDIVWHTIEILSHPPVGKIFTSGVEPLVTLREHRELALDAIQVFVYTQDQANLFAVTMAVFDQMDLDVMDARIITATRDFALDSYVLIDRQGTLLNDAKRQAELKQRLIDAFKNPTMPKLVQKRLPRQLKNFVVPTTVNFKFNSANNQHIMTLTTLDQPGLLARVGQVFLSQNIEVHAARITTLGERAEDMFYISDQGDKALPEQTLNILEQTLVDLLSV